MKFYDKGFIQKFPTYTKVTIFSAGVTILELKIYEDKICKNLFACESLKEFNEKHLASSYEDGFLKELFEKDEKNITHKDSKNNILIKIFKD